MILNRLLRYDSDMLRLNNIHRSFPVGPTTLNVLNGVDLNVKRGEMIAIMGESGSGKSTLMNILGLLDTPDGGSYEINGQTIGTLSDEVLSETRNSLIGFVFQSFHLLPRLTAIENVCLPLVYRGLDVNDQLEMAAQMLAKVGLSERSGHKPDELSGGQCQRVAIARALAGSPSLVLADEPTGALDPNVGREIMELFIQLNQQDDMTTIIITHDPGVAERCQTTYMMEQGKLTPVPPKPGELKSV